MSAIRLPERYHPDFAIPGKKPSSGGLRIKWKHPASKGLWGVYIFNDGVPVNLVNGNVAEIQGNASITVRNGERSLKTINGNDRIVLKNGSLGTKNVSVIGRAAYNVAQDSALFDVNNQKLLLWADHLTGTLRPSVFAGGAQHGIAGSLPHDGTYKTWGVRLKQNGTRADAWISLEGEVEIGPVNAGTTDFTNNGTGDISIGANFSQTSKTTKGNTSFVFIWTRTLEDREMSSLIDDPWQILEPAAPIMYFTADAPAASRRLYLLPKRYHPDFATPSKKPVGQVEIDDQWQGRVLHAVMPAMGNALFNVVDKKIHNLTGVTSQVGRQGVELDTTGTPSPVKLDITNINKSRGCHVLSIVPDSTGTWNYLFDSTGDRQLLSFRDNGNIIYYADGVQRTYKLATLGFNVGDYINIVVEWPSSNIYINGELFASGTSSAISNIGDEFTLFARYTDADHFDGKRVFFATINGECDARSLSRDPYQVLKPVTPISYFTPSGATPPVGLAIPIVMYHRRQFNRG